MRKGVKLALADFKSVLKMRTHFEKFLCQADAWHTAVLQIYIPKGIYLKN